MSEPPRKATLPMLTCVVTPYFQTDPAWLLQAHDSVRSQATPTHHIMVCDGSPPADVPGFQGTHIVLPRNYRDYGNTPRLFGFYQALSLGADAIAFLDGDNWFYPGHLTGLLGFAQANNLDACASARMLHRLDGTPMIRCTDVDGVRHIDTNCLLVMKPAFSHMLAWVLARQENAGVADQYVWQHLRSSGARLGFLDQVTVAYRTRHAAHYERAGEAPPPDAIRRSDQHGDRYH